MSSHPLSTQRHFQKISSLHPLPKQNIKAFPLYADWHANVVVSHSHAHDEDEGQQYFPNITNNIW